MFRRMVMGYNNRFSIFGMFRRLAIYWLSFILKYILFSKRKTSPQVLARYLRLARLLVWEPLRRSRVDRAIQRCSENDPILKLVSRFMNELSFKAKAGFLDTVIVHELLLAHHQKEKSARETWDPHPGWMAVSPLMTCNKSCIGCYANGREDGDALTPAEFARVLKEGEELGIHVVCLTGGEPLMRDDLWAQIKRRKHQMFLLFTNGELIDQSAVDRMAKLGNIVPLLSLEGPKEFTDRRRGPGTFAAVTSAMARLRKRGVLFGASITISSQNAEAVSSMSFARDMVERGALIGWYTLYLPLGANPDLSLMAAPEQRLKAMKNLKNIRGELPLAVVDMFNDGHFLNGCSGAGRLFFHINNHGDVEPCNFAHFSSANIRNMTLKEALDQTFFHEFRRCQPFGDNLLMPCPILDYPGKFKSLVTGKDVRPSHPGAPCILEPGVQKHLKEYAANLAKLAKPVWEKEFSHRQARRRALLGEN